MNTTFEACCADSRLVDLRLRIDLRRSDVGELCQRVLSFIQAMGGMLVRAPDVPVPGTLPDMMAALKGSPAFRFVNDPGLFLRRTALGGLEDA